MRADCVTRLTFCAALFLAAVAQAQKEYVPEARQPGKDVIWLPSPNEVVDQMLRAAQLKPRDILIDLGSGDGRIVMAAARIGANALGIEYNPDLVEFSKRAARKAGVASKARFVRGDIFQTDFSRATVITMYLLAPLNERLKPTLLALKPGTRIVSYQFQMGEWEPDEVTEIDGHHPIYLWIVPAQASGIWTLQMEGKRYEMVIEQKFQKIRGSVRWRAVRVGMREARLRGDRIRFALVGEDGVQREFAGTVTGKHMAGSMKPNNGQGVRFTGLR